MNVNCKFHAISAALNAEKYINAECEDENGHTTATPTQRITLRKKLLKEDMFNPDDVIGTEN